jgi:hypothetical protein
VLPIQEGIVHVCVELNVSSAVPDVVGLPQAEAVPKL